MIKNVIFILMAEITERAQNGIGSGLSQSAQRRVLNYFGHFFQKLDISFFSLTLGDIGQNVQHSLGTFTAGCTFTAGFILAEIHEETRHIYCALVFIHYD